MHGLSSSSKIILTLEGNIGAGKSTFLRMISSNLPVDIVYEPTDKWQDGGHGGNLLGLFYQDTKRWAYTFQSYAFVSRVQAQNESLAKESSALAQVLERSVYCDRYCFAKNCFENGLMSELEWHLYTEWFGWLVDTYTTKPDGFIYLRTKPQTCLERMHKRNRSEESAVPLAYLEQLHQRHEQWLVHKENVGTNIRNVPVLVLDCDSEFETNAVRAREHISRVQEFIAQLQQSKNGIVPNRGIEREMR